MVDPKSPFPLPEPIKRARRRRGSSGIASTDTSSLIALALDAPGAIVSGIEGIGRGITGLVGKDTGGTPDSTSEPGNGGGFDVGSVTGSIGNAVSAAGEGIGKVAGATGDGVGFVTSNAGSVLTGAGDVLSGAAEVAGTVISAVTDVAGPVASAAGEVAGAAGDAAGAVLGALGDLNL